MEPIDISLIILLLIFVFTIPFIRKFVVYQFLSLLIGAFIIGYLFNELAMEEHKNGLIILVMLIVGIAFNSVKFFKRNVINSVN